MADVRYRVVNKCKHDIGIVTVNGQGLNIRPNSFALLSADDILFIESLCRIDKYFSKKMLVPYNTKGEEVPLEEIGLYKDETVVEHLDDQQIETMLKSPLKKFETWIEGVEDPAELHAIYEVAKNMELTSSKLKILAAKMPEKDFI